jgi:hypothetical protein
MHCRQNLPVLLLAAFTLLFSFFDAEEFAELFAAPDACVECSAGTGRESADDCCPPDGAPCPNPCQFCGCQARAIPTLSSGMHTADITAQTFIAHLADCPFPSPDLDVDLRPPRLA